MKKLLLFPDIETSPSLTASSNCSCNETIWEEGRVLSTTDYDFSNLEYVCETLPLNKVTDFSATDTGVPILSGRLKALFDHLNIAAQYFPAKIIEKSGDTANTDFFAMNIIGLVDCIDFEKSDLNVKEKDGKIRRIIDINTLKLKEERFGDIYRIYMFSRAIVIEGVIGEKLKELNISGMKLIEPEKWDGIASVKSN